MYSFVCLFKARAGSPGYLYIYIYILTHTHYTHVCKDEEANNVDNFVIVPKKSHAPAEAKVLGTSLESNLMIDLLGLVGNMEMYHIRVI